MNQTATGIAMVHTGKDVKRITKVQDLKFDNAHPNGINIGYSLAGSVMGPLEVGLPILIVGHVRMLITSPITQIIDENTYRTMNSIYTLKNVED